MAEAGVADVRTLFLSRSGWRAWAHALLVLLLVLLLVQAMPAFATDHSPEEALAERRIKAAYLYRFAGYAEWPPIAFTKADAPLVIGIWGNDDLADDLAGLVAARTIEGRRLEVRRVKDASGLAGLHVLFLARDRTSRLAEALASPQLGMALVVTESPGALSQGSALNFLIIDGQIRFELSLEAAEKRGLKLSSRLVAVSNNAQARNR